MPHAQSRVTKEGDGNSSEKVINYEKCIQLSKNLEKKVTVLE